MKLSTTPFALIFHLLVYTFLHKSTFAAEKSYIVLLGSHPHDIEPKLVDVQKVQRSHHDLLGLILGSKKEAKRKIHYSYTMHMDAFGAFLDEDLARNISQHPDVISVYESKSSNLHTTYSWDFIGMEKNGEVPVDSIWKKANFGKDMIVACIDDGVWPTSKSFMDDGIIGPIPSKWRGFCDFKESGFSCNKKLIGARYFNEAFATICEHAVKLNLTIEAPRRGCREDTASGNAGHGTHTLSIAGGSFVPNTSIFGLGLGTAKGGAPMARVASYKVCFPAFPAFYDNSKTYIGECLDNDVLAGYDAAIADGVDVINLSLGGGEVEYFKDTKSIAALHAVKRGIVVVACAGNDGPRPSSVMNVSPWFITVGSSSTDREFVNYVVLANGNANGTRLKGSNLSDKLMEQKPYPVITGLQAKNTNATSEDAIHCKREAIDVESIRDKILICRVNLTTAKASTISNMVAVGGGVGFVSVNNDPMHKLTFSLRNTYVPSSHLDSDQGELLFSYVNFTQNPMLYITPTTTEFGAQRPPAPVVSYSSSRGPNPVQPSILKPDIIAPGVNILAAYPDNIAPGGEFIIEDKRRIDYNVMSGTSMAAPHVAGVAALLKSIHPDWSSAAIKSAIMTTASTEHNKEALFDSTMLKATPFERGAGQIQPNLAMDPGLVYDLTNDDYMNHLCAHGYNQTILRVFSHVPYNCPASFSHHDFNYPSITVPDLGDSPITVTRRLKNVGSIGTYNAQVSAPPEISAEVSPPSLTFGKMGEELTFTMVIKRTSGIKFENYVFGELVWSDGKHFVKSPLVVKSMP